MIGEHTVTFIPDPDVSAWGPVLNSNPYMTTDINGWRDWPWPTTGPWSWGAGGYAMPPPLDKVPWLTRDETAPILRGASTLFRVRFRVSVAQSCGIWYGLFYGDTPHNAMLGPNYPGVGAAHAYRIEQQLWTPSGGNYVLEIVHDPGPVPTAFTYLAPEIHAGPNDNLIIDSIEVWGQGAEAIDISCLVDTVEIHHGRDDTNNQPDAPSATIDMSLVTGQEEFPSALEVGGIIRVTTNTALASSTRFLGRVTDLLQGWDEAGPQTPNNATIRVIATGMLAELGRRIVGDTPWAQELDGSRVSRIMAAAGITLDPATSDPGTVQILARDVDSQPALDVAHSVADSASGIVWATRDGDIRYADANHRRGQTASLTLDACDILVTPTWSRTTSGLINSVSIGYGAAPAGGGDQPRYVASRADSIAAFGTYGFSSTTELAALADATALGQLLITRNRVPVWIMSTLPVDVEGLSPEDTAALLALDMHDLLSLTGLPAAGNVPTSALLWVEGWTETLEYGRHDLELIVSGYCRTSPAPRWNDMAPTQTWDGMGTLTWDDATCFGPSPNLGRWDDVPASSRWDQLQTYLTWDTWPTPGF